MNERTRFIMSLVDFPCTHAKPFFINTANLFLNGSHGPGYHRSLLSCGINRESSSLSVEHTKYFRFPLFGTGEPANRETIKVIILQIFLNRY